VHLWLKILIQIRKHKTDKEIKNLTQLIAEPRQSKEFKSKNFVYEGTKRNIPQEVINRLR
jgi:hypothetical protein